MNLVEFVKNKTTSDSEIEQDKHLMFISLKINNCDYIYLINVDNQNYSPIVENIFLIIDQQWYFCNSSTLQDYIKNFQKTSFTSERDFMSIKSKIELYCTNILISFGWFQGKFV